MPEEKSSKRVDLRLSDPIASKTPLCEAANILHEHFGKPPMVLIVVCHQDYIESGIASDPRVPESLMQRVNDAVSEAVLTVIMVKDEPSEG